MTFQRTQLAPISPVCVLIAVTYLRRSSQNRGVQPVKEWGQRRAATIGLAVFFIGWYGLELAVFHGAGEHAARWWFYFEKPPNHISPGILTASLSHDLYSVTHIGTNVALLFVVGALAEPYIGKERLLVAVIGIGYIGTYLANVTALYHRMWIVAGASGGILALVAYTGLRLRHRAVTGMTDGLTWSWYGVETVIALSLLIGTPILLLHQTIWIASPHSGHVIGMLLGCLYYGVDAHFEGSELTNRRRRSIQEE